MNLIPDGPFGERVARRLREDALIWFTTVGSDGTPQPNPVWFVWDGADTVVVYNRADAQRLRHVAERPEIALHLDGDGRGGDIVVLAGAARRDDTQPPAHEHRIYAEKYAEGMARVSGSAEQFSEQYPVPLVIEVRRIRGH